MPPATREEAIRIAPVTTETITVAVRGVRPLICNRVAEKARRELLLPSGRKTAADRAGSLKHDPIAEYQASPYRLREDDAPTLIGLPASSFKKAMMSAALDMPGAKKTVIGRLVWVEGDLLPIYGEPKLFCAITRSADMNRTPDVRTRAIVPAWATVLTINFVVPLLNETSVLNLLAAAGQIAGVGDWRPEKGSGTYGQFILTNAEEDLAYQHIVAQGGRAAQSAALADPEPYDMESEELLGWFDVEVKQRGKGALRKAA